MSTNISTILKNTKNNIIRNKWMSLSTVLVISIVFTISCFFTSLAFIAQRAVQFYETKAQVIIFFKKEAPESEILKLKTKIDDPNTVESIEYTSQKQALENFRKDFANDPELLDTVTSDTLPPSLGIRAKTIGDLADIIKSINKEKETNAYIDDVWYFKEVVDKIKTISKIINYGSIVLISGLGVITISLIIITISFNIMAHKDEIEIMHLVGSSDSLIKMPYILEGATYGAIGALISIILILGPWYTAMYFSKGSDLNLWVQQFLNDLSLGFLGGFRWSFVLIYTAAVTGIGIVVGGFGSSTAVLKYLNLREK